MDEQSLSIDHKSMLDLPIIQSAINSASRKTYAGPKHVVSGTTVDAIADKNLNEIKDLKAGRGQLLEELKEVRDRNERLFNRVDYLEDIIRKEASANTYFYDYPPKPDRSLKRVDMKERKGANAESEA